MADVNASKIIPFNHRSNFKNLSKKRDNLYYSFPSFDSLTSSAYKNTIFEMKYYFAHTLTKGDNWGHNNKSVWEYDEPGISFLFKDYNMNHEKYNALNDEGKSFHSLINGIFVLGTPSTYFISTLIQDTDRYKSILSKGNTDKTDCPEITDNEYCHLVNFLKEYTDKNHNWASPHFIHIPDTPYKEYVYNAKKPFSMNVENILYNGQAKNYPSKNIIYSEDYKKMGYAVLSYSEWQKKCDEWQNEVSGKWQEISKKSFDDSVNSVFHNAKNLNKLFNNDGFFYPEPHKGDLQQYYHKIDDRYFTSLQRTSYDQKYIEKNLLSHISRCESLESRKKQIIEYFKEYYPQILNSINNNKTHYFTDKLMYDILKGENISVVQHKRTGLDGIDGKYYEHSFYSYNIDDQTAQKLSNNKLDHFASLFLCLEAKKQGVTVEKLANIMHSISLQGDIFNFSKELFQNKNKTFHNETLLNNLFHNNTCKYKIIPPTLHDISSFAVSNGISIDNYIKNNNKTAEHNIDNPDKTFITLSSGKKI